MANSEWVVDRSYAGKRWKSKVGVLVEVWRMTHPTNPSVKIELTNLMFANKAKGEFVTSHNYESTELTEV
jgi:hypothetical protein